MGFFEERLEERNLMVRNQIAARGIRDRRVLRAMRQIPRHIFVPFRYSSEAYDDCPLPIGSGQTISQPYIVAFMAESLQLRGDERILEIGTGSGYQTAILSCLAAQVFSIERIAELLEDASITLGLLGIENVKLKLGDGFFGWNDEAPFDAIILSAAPLDLPAEILRQLKEGARLVAPVGNFGAQALLRVTKRTSHFDTEALLDVTFVPMLPGIEMNSPL
jgi:protein-L-isoaspartate(D-aspartate) O-methyltransferase